MEKQKLPNEQAVMILGLISFIGCCCTNGFLGLLLSGLGIYFANKSEKLLISNPDELFFAEEPSTGNKIELLDENGIQYTYKKIWDKNSLVVK